MAARRRTRLILGASGSQLPLDRLAERDLPRRPTSDPPAAVATSSPDALLNERRARWLEERARFERARARPSPSEPAAEPGAR